MLKKIGILVGLVSAMLGLFPPAGVAIVAPSYQQRQTIQEITRDISTPEKKTEAVAKLMAVVGNAEEDINLREFGAQYLGDMGAVQARDMLKNLAETLEWKDPNWQLKRAVTLAYWKIRVIEEPTSKAQEDLLMKLLPGLYPGADVVPTWAAEELADRGIKEALPEIIKWVRYRNPTERGENVNKRSKVYQLSARKVYHLWYIDYAWGPTSFRC